MIQHQLIEKGTIVVEISLVQEIPHPLCLEAIVLYSSKPSQSPYMGYRQLDMKEPFIYMPLLVLLSTLLE